MDSRHIVKGSHCFKQIHLKDYLLEDRGYESDRMLTLCAYDGGATSTHLDEGEYTGPEHEICSSLGMDEKYLEFRRKLYGGE
ncbi:MAG: hypothetical protein IH874_03000 [Candidatus Dadabacteria bacterium]|nr:hypothetical protein [Candidatus Dadabacteria bacterium]